MNNLTRFITQDSVELVIDTKTGETFVTQEAYSKMAGLTRQAINKRCKKDATLARLKSLEIDLGQGLQARNFIPADLFFEWVVKDNPQLAIAMGKAGATVFLHQLAGFKISSEAANEARDISAKRIEALEFRVQELECKLAAIAPDNCDTVAPGWNPDLWKRLSKTERYWHWKQFNKYGWMPSDQMEEVEPQKLLPGVEEQAKQLQQQELNKLLAPASEEELERVKKLREEALSKLTELSE